MSEPQPLHDLTAFQRDTLTVVAKGDGLKGLAVKAELEDLYDQEVNHGRLYPNLDALVQKGLVSKAERDKRTNEYSVTARGRRELSGHIRWLIEALREGGAIYVVPEDGSAPFLIEADENSTATSGPPSSPGDDG